MTLPTIHIEALESGEPIEIATAAQGILTLGREPENSVILSENAISRRHACIFPAGTQWVYRDLASTNGSWLNRVKLPPGSSRLLRNTDLLQLATTPLLVALTSNEEFDPTYSSLIVLSGDDFHSEIPAASPDFKIMVGGERADLPLEGSNGAGDQLMIRRVGDRLELTITMLGAKVQVNGLVVGGTTALSDRDEIVVGNYTILVNDLGNIPKQEVLWAQAGSAAAGAQFGSPVERPTAMDEWGSESQKRRALSQRKFIFGSPSDITGTLSMEKDKFLARAGLEISSSQRFSQTNLAVEPGPVSQISDRLTMIFGFVVFVVIIAAIVLLWLV